MLFNVVNEKGLKALRITILRPSGAQVGFFCMAPMGCHCAGSLGGKVSGGGGEEWALPAQRHPSGPARLPHSDNYRERLRLTIALRRSLSQTPEIRGLYGRVIDSGIIYSLVNGRPRSRRYRRARLQGPGRV
jgi:hypothetical protein